MAANAGKYSEAERYFSTEALAAMKGPLGQIAGGFKGIADSNTRNGQIRVVEVLKQEIRGEGATVTARIAFKDGSTKENDVTELIREKGEWKITLGGN